MDVRGTKMVRLRMKIAPVVAVVLCVSGFSAASVGAQTFSAGIEAGGGVSTISPTPEGETVAYGPGLLAGVYASYPLFPAVGVQIEADYVQKHTRVTTAGTDSTLNLDYFEIPVLAKLPLFKGIYILEGIAFGFPVNAAVKSSSDAEIDIKDTTTSPDLGLIIGVVFPAGKLGVEGRYAIGFKSIDATGISAVRNRSLFVVVRIPLR